MSKKTSLGHNPLAYSLKNHASFDFIRNIQNNSESGSIESEIRKKVASYYLEERVIDKIKEIAKEEEDSFSSVVNRFLKEGIKNRYESE
jgi:hypothetical protein